MKEFIKAMDNLPWIIKVILCVPALDVIWAVYRIIKGYCTKNPLILLVGVIWIVPGIFLGWLIDMFCMIFVGKLPLA